MSQCVPSWDIDDPPTNPSSNLPLHHCHPSAAPLDPLASYEMAELTWENGQLALRSLVPPRIGKPVPKHAPAPSVVSAAAAWNKPHHPSGTLESVVNQATGAAALSTASPDFEDWFGGLRRPAAVDALVPCHDDVVAASNNRVADRAESSTAGRKRKRARAVGVCSSQGSAAGSLAAGRVDSTTLVTLDTCREDEVGLTATAAATATNSASPETENTSLEKRKALAFDDHVSISHGSSHTKHYSSYDEDEKATKREAAKNSASTKKSRAAAVHNQSERKRRDRINQRMKTLQKLVPNSSKTDKASMLDEVIEYMKQLQAQVQMMSRMSNMMMPMAAAMPQLQMPMMAAHMAQMSQLPQLGMGVGVLAGMMDLNSMVRSMPAATLPLLHPSAFLPLAAAAAGGACWDGSGDRRPSVLPDYSALLACQMAPQQPMTMSLDEYSRMASLFQQLYQHQPQAIPKS